MTIPSRAHFCWIGPHLPWAYVFAVLSAAEQGELSEVVLHHTDPLEAGPERDALVAAPGVRLSPFDPAAYLTQVGDALGVGDGLVALYRAVDRPVARSNILRAAILYREGGVYLDLDTITTRSLRPLLDAPQFIGCEFIVWPQFVRRSHSPLVWARHLTLDVVRKILQRMPDGWKTFRRIERFYFRGVNGAVMGAEPHASLLTEYLRAMLAVPPGRREQPYALGTELLQEVIDRHRWDDLVIEEPRTFYPLPPEISEQWFRIGRRISLDAVLSAETRVVHWYASVRTRSRIARIDPGYVRDHRDRQLYSALVCACVRNLPRAA